MDQEAYGNSADSTDIQQERSFRELLNTKFSRYTFVGVKNILSKPIRWTIALEQNELLNMSPGGMNEEEMIRQKAGNFLPGDAVTKGKTRVVTYELQPGEKKMILGEAAYVIIDKIYSLYIKEKFVPQLEPGKLPDMNQLALTKAGLAKIRSPHFQEQTLPLILVGPIIKNIDGALQTYVNEKMNEIEDFTDVQAHQPITLDPEVVMQEKRKVGRPRKQTTPA